jgi:hypothetical protein
MLVGADLSPIAYRRLPEVIARARQGAAHAASVCVAMADDNEFDPFKD